MGVGEDFLPSMKKKRLQKLTANIDDFCWRRGNGLMTNGQFITVLRSLTLNFPKN